MPFCPPRAVCKTGLGFFLFSYGKNLGSRINLQDW